MSKRLEPQELRRAIDCGAFDADFYLEQNPDVAAAGLDPLDHYLAWGQKEGRRPSKHFDPSAYLSANRDLAERDIDPFVHYVRVGSREGRPRSPVEALGRKLGLSPAEFEGPVDPALVAAAANLPEFWQHYREVEESGLFDPAFYRAQIPWLGQEVDPLTHYLIYGYRAFVDPSKEFSGAEYCVLNPDVARSDVDPLVHYLVHGREERRFTTFAERDERLARTTSYLTGLEPSEQVSLERMRGAAYLFRYGFTLEKNSSLDHASRAIDDLATHRCALKIEPETPDATIVIPVHGQLQVLLNCLDSLAAQTSRYTAEILVVDDASPLESRVAEIARIPWLRYLPQDRNTGFIGACNLGAAASRGKHLVFLNNDTRVLPDWLDELIGSFSLFPKAGLVGSKLINEDETLQEAGGIVWRDGEVWNFGRGDFAFRAEYGFAREVDYCSAASLAVTAEAWREVGGFNTLYATAYCEDTDLAFKLREAGFETWLQPLSLVIHYEGMSHGKDVRAGVKAHQVENLKKFYARWRGDLGSHGDAKQGPYPEADRTKPRRALVLDALTPTPDRDAGSVIAHEMIRLFLEMGWQVSFAPRCHRFDGKYTRSLQRLGVEVLIAPDIHTIADIIQTRPNAYDVILAFRWKTLTDCYDALRSAYPKARIVFHDIDLHYLRLRRQAELSDDRLLRMEAELVQDAELELFAKCDCSVVVTQAEKEIIDSQIPTSNVVVYPYTIEATRSDRPFEDRRHVCFIGGFRHEPNVDAVLYFLREIWPLVTPKLPDNARFMIIGPDAPDSIRDLASDRVVVTGHVPDLGSVLDDCRLSVVPLRYGAGIKGKLVTTLAYGLPSVASTLAVEGMGLEQGRHVLIADDPEAFAEATIRLFHDRETWLSLQQQGYTFVEETYSRKRGLEACEHILDVAYATWMQRKEAARKRRLAELGLSATRPDKLKEPVLEWAMSR